VSKDKTARGAGLLATGLDGSSKQDLISSFASQPDERGSGQQRASQQSLDQLYSKVQKKMASAGVNQKAGGGITRGGKMLSGVSGRKQLSERSDGHSQSQGGDQRAQSSPDYDDIRSSQRGPPSQQAPKELSPAEHVEQYKQYFEQLEKKMIKERQEARMKNFGSAEAGLDEENQAKRRAQKQLEYEQELERLTILANTRTVYQDNGERMLLEMRDQQLSTEK